MSKQNKVLTKTKTSIDFELKDLMSGQDEAMQFLAKLQDMTPEDYIGSTTAESLPSVFDYIKNSDEREQAIKDFGDGGALISVQRVVTYRCKYEFDTPQPDLAFSALTKAAEAMNLTSSQALRSLVFMKAKEDLSSLSDEIPAVQKSQKALEGLS